MKTRWLDGLAGLVIIAALALRLLSLNQFIAADELRWVCRSLNFGQALATGALADTFQTGHPGVLTMWAGSLAVPAATAPQALATCAATDTATAPSAVGMVELAGLADVLWRMRVGVALLTTALLAAVYRLARRVLGPLAALFGLILLAFDPFFLAHSRVLHLDALLSGLLLVSVLALLAAFLPSAARAPDHAPGTGVDPSGPPPVPSVSSVVRPRPPSTLFLVLSGAVAGVALTQKVAAVFVLPWAGLALAWLTWQSLDPDRRHLGAWLRALLRHGLVWGLALVAAVFIVWPAAWAAPVATLRGVINKAAIEGGNPHQAGQFIDEEIVDDPGAFMYVLALLFRASPWLFVGVPLGAWAAWRAGRRANVRVAVVGLLAFALLFGALIAFSPKKFDRYLLPVFPPLDLVAGVGLAALASFRVRPRASQAAGRGDPPWPPSAPGQEGRHGGLPLQEALALALVAAVQLALLLPYAPYYLTYYNPLLGGGPAATRWLLVGWGEGYDQAARFLNQLQTAQRQTAVRGVSQFAPLYIGETRSAPGYRPYQTRFVVLYLNEIQRRRNEGLIQRYYDNPDAKPLHIVTLNGIDYAWVYENTTANAPLAAIEAERRPGDAFVVNGDSLAADRLPLDVPQAKIYGHFRAAEMAETLAALPPVQRLWYLRYPAADPGVVLDALREHAILDGEVRQFPDVEVWRFRPAPPADRAANADFGPLRLVGWGAESGAAMPGTPMGVTLAWQPTAPVTGDAVAEVEAVDAEGRVVARVEKPARDAALRPASQWAVGDRVETLAPLTVPPGTPPGEYTLRAGIKGAGQTATLGNLSVARGGPTDGIQIPTRLDAPAGPGLRLAGHGLPPAAPAGTTLDAPLVWRADGPVAAASADLALRDAAGRLGPTTSAPLLGVPLSQWQPGDVFRAIRTVTIPADAATGAAYVEVMPRDAAGGALLDTPISLGPLWLQGRPLTAPPRLPHQATAYRVADTATLLGYDATQAAPGAPLDLTLTWRADRATPTDYTAFVHLLAPDGRIVSQIDRAPGLGQYPTSQWQAGEVVADPYRLDVPPDTPPGRYQVAAGWYAPAGRAEARDAAGQRLAEDRILLDVDVR